MPFGELQLLLVIIPQQVIVSTNPGEWCRMMMIMSWQHWLIETPILKLVGNFSRTTLLSFHHFLVVHQFNCPLGSLCSDITGWIESLRLPRRTFLVQLSFDSSSSRGPSLEELVPTRWVLDCSRWVNIDMGLIGRTQAFGPHLFGLFGLGLLFGKATHNNLYHSVYANVLSNKLIHVKPPVVSLSKGWNHCDSLDYNDLGNGLFNSILAVRKLLKLLRLMVLGALMVS